MFSNFTIGLLFGAGCAAWVYNKMMRSTGGNINNSLTVAGFAGVGAMVLIITVLGAFLN